MKNYDIFISHSSKDKLTIAKGLAKDLENLEYKAWYDSNEIEGSENWIKEIEKGIDSSSVVIVIWTENAAKSKWVDRELARADHNGTPIIPLVFDDTTVNNILLQSIQYIDFRQGYLKAFQPLTSLLTRLLDYDARSIVATEGFAWRPAKRPYYRSQFLEENEYLDRNSPKFAINSRTKHLIDFSRNTQASSFISVVIVPVPEPIDFEFTKLLKLPNIGSDPYQIQYKDVPKETTQGQRFSFTELQHKNTTLTDCLLYKPSPHKPDDFPLGAYYYVRFDENGSIEYADSTKVQLFGGQDGGFQGAAFNLISILGTVWKCINLACNIYNWFEYAGKAQILLNLKNTADTTIGGFAIDPHNKKTWSSRLRYESSMWAFDDINQGIARDQNLQFVYDFEVSSFLKTGRVSEDLIVHLSNKLQRAFNWSPADRHYIPDTTDFPWNQFYQQSYPRI